MLNENVIEKPIHTFHTFASLEAAFKWVFSGNSSETSYMSNSEEQENQNFIAKQAFFKALQTIQRTYASSKSEVNFKISGSCLDREYIFLKKLLQFLRPLLYEVGFSMSWEHVFMKHEMIHVSCVLTHKMGEIRCCHVALPLSSSEKLLSNSRYRINAMACAKRYALYSLLGLSNQATTTTTTTTTTLVSASGQDLQDFMKIPDRVSNGSLNSVVFLKDSQGEQSKDCEWNQERQCGGSDYKRIITFYQKKLQKLVSLGLRNQEVKKFIAFGDFLMVGEPSYEEILHYGKRLTQFLQQIEANMYLKSPIFVRGKNSTPASSLRRLPKPETLNKKNLSVPNSKGPRVAGFKKIKTNNFTKKA